MGFDNDIYPNPTLELHSDDENFLDFEKLDNLIKSANSKPIRFVLWSAQFNRLIIRCSCIFPSKMHAFGHQARFTKDPKYEDGIL